VSTVLPGLDYITVVGRVIKRSYCVICFLKQGLAVLVVEKSGQEAESWLSLIKDSRKVGRVVNFEESTNGDRHDYDKQGKKGYSLNRGKICCNTAEHRHRFWILYDFSRGTSEEFLSRGKAGIFAREI
jgi:hypothetical protein